MPCASALAPCAALIEQILGYELQATIDSGAAADVVADDFASLASAVVASFERGEMPTGGEADFEGKWKEWTKTLGASTGRKGKKLFMPLRLALTGSLSGPDVGATMQMIAMADGRSAKLVPMAARMAALKAVKLPASA